VDSQSMELDRAFKKAASQKDILTGEADVCVAGFFLHLQVVGARILKYIKKIQLTSDYLISAYPVNSCFFIQRTVSCCSYLPVLILEKISWYHMIPFWSGIKKGITNWYRDTFMIPVPTRIFGVDT
jgi:hypothetical protein